MPHKIQNCLILRQQQMQPLNLNLRQPKPLRTLRPWSKRRRKRLRKKLKKIFESKSMKMRWQKSKTPARLPRRRLPNSKPRPNHKLQRSKQSDFVHKRKQHLERLRTRPGVWQKPNWLKQSSKQKQNLKPPASRPNKPKRLLLWKPNASEPNKRPPAVPQKKKQGVLLKRNWKRLRSRRKPTLKPPASRPNKPRKPLPQKPNALAQRPKQRKPQNKHRFLIQPKS